MRSNHQNNRPKSTRYSKKMKMTLIMKRFKSRIKIHQHPVKLSTTITSKQCKQQKMMIAMKITNKDLEITTKLQILINIKACLLIKNFQTLNLAKETTNHHNYHSNHISSKRRLNKILNRMCLGISKKLSKNFFLTSREINSPNSLNISLQQRLKINLDFVIIKRI